MLKTSQMMIMLLSFTSMAIADVQNLGSEITPPRPEGGIQAIAKRIEYPSSAAATRIESLVILRFLVNQTGTVSNISVVQSGGDIFDESAIAAIKKVKWVPAIVDNQNIKVYYELPFKFCCK